MRAVWWAVLCAAGILVLPSGCGGGPGDMPDLGRVEGTVTLGGQPLPDATVDFIPEKGVGRPSSGVTDDKGHYELRYDVDHLGAKVGSHTVKISTSKIFANEQGEETVTPEKVPARYNAQSTLVREVESGEQTFDFKL